MLRTPLVELCLQIKLLSLGQIKPFLSKVKFYCLQISSVSFDTIILQVFFANLLSQALEPPRDEAMSSAISVLYEVVLCCCLIF